MLLWRLREPFMVDIIQFSHGTYLWLLGVDSSGVYYYVAINGFYCWLFKINVTENILSSGCFVLCRRGGSCVCLLCHNVDGPCSDEVIFVELKAAAVIDPPTHGTRISLHDSSARQRAKQFAICND